MRPERLTRRAVTRGAGGAALGGVLLGTALGGCAPGGEGSGAGGQTPSNAPVKISYLRYYNQPDRLAGEQAIFKRLQEQRPGLTIDELTVAGTTEMIQQMTASYAAGTAPDTWTTAPTIYHEYVRAGNLLQLERPDQAGHRPQEALHGDDAGVGEPGRVREALRADAGLRGHHPLLQQEPARRRPGALPGRLAGPTTP